jgi:hypothetical protein
MEESGAGAEGEALLSQQDQRHMTMLAIRLVELLLERGTSSRIAVMSGE